LTLIFCTYITEIVPAPQDSVWIRERMCEDLREWMCEESDGKFMELFSESCEEWCGSYGCKCARSS